MRNSRGIENSHFVDINKMRRIILKGKEAANQTHYDVGKKVRETIQELGGTMPEELPTPRQEYWPA